MPDRTGVVYDRDHPDFPPSDGDVPVYDASTGKHRPAPGGLNDPATDTRVWMPLTTTVAGELEFVTDGDGDLIPTLVPLEDA